MDGGKVAWCTIMGVWLVQFCTYGYTSAFGVYQEYYDNEFLSHVGPSNISWIGSFQLFMQYIPGMVVGRLFDAGYFHHIILAGTVLQVVSMFMLSLCQRDHYYQVRYCILTQAVGMGLGQALLFLPSLTVIGYHFKNKRSLATGIAVSGASIGGIMWPIILNQLRRQIAFPNAIRVTAGITALLLCVSNVLMKTGTQTRLPAKVNVKGIFRDSAYLSSIAAAFLTNIGLFFPYFYLQLYSMELGIDQSLSFYAVTFLNLGSFVGRLVPGFFADRLGVYNLLLPCLYLSGVLAFAMYAIKTFQGVVLFSIFFGFWSGAYVSLIPSLLAQLSARGEHGLRMGMSFSIVGISVLIGTPAEGALLQLQNNDRKGWLKPIVLSGVSSDIVNYADRSMTL
ncbi:MFS general substrate transporter [Panaeolus papilionaceus]|nr:MFS general substrate transporter [Panaeolus papilionaceus]